MADNIDPSVFGSASATATGSRGLVPYPLAARQNWTLSGRGWRYDTTPLFGSKTWSTGAITTLVQVSTTCTVTGATVGDQVLLGHTTGFTAGLILTGSVSAADTVTATMFNGTAGTLTPASGTLYVRVFKALPSQDDQQAS